MNTLKDFVPGQKQLSAAQLNEMVDILRSVTGMQVGDGLQFDKAGMVYQLNRTDPVTRRWGKITGEGTSTLAGKYAWTEQTDTTGVFTDLTGGIVGTVAGVAGETLTIDPLTEVNGATGIPSGTIVEVIEGTPTVDTGTTGNPIDSHYRFVVVQSLEYESFYKDGNLALSALSTEYNVTNWIRKSDSAPLTYLEFPSDGYWLLTVQLTGYIVAITASGGAAGPIVLVGRLFDVDTGVSSLTTYPEGCVVNAVTVNGSGQYVGYGTYTFSTIWKVDPVGSSRRVKVTGTIQPAPVCLGSVSGIIGSPSPFVSTVGATNAIMYKLRGL